MTLATEDVTKRKLKGRLLPVEWCLVGYLALTGILLVVAGEKLTSPVPMLFRIGFFAWIVVALRVPMPESGVLRIARIAYPLFLYPYFYEELATLNQLVTTTRFDALVVDVERVLFQSMPAVELRGWLPWWPLSEVLHFCYVSYYVIGLFVLARFAFMRHVPAIAETVTVTTTTFIGCYLWFIAFPVVGPFHYMTPPNPDDVGHVFPQLTHWILNRGSSEGTAFPSSHVAVTTAALWQAWRYDRAFAGPILAFILPGLAIGAIYGGFHYATDAVAGFLFALLTIALGRRLHDRLAPAALRRLTA